MRLLLTNNLIFLDDVFGIDEVTMYEGEWTDKNYSATGDVLDGVSETFIFVVSKLKF